MNERIQELAEQAGFDSVSMVRFGIEQDLEKFAVLIVRDCATWIDEQSGWDGPYGHELLHFFGVKPL